ncbi:MAG TPA: hypothetical protein VIX19_02490 [Terriglobales bacterium]
MNSFYILGGRQRRNVLVPQEEWTLYDKALILRLEPDTGETRVCVEYQTPPGARPDGIFTIFFKAAFLEGNRLFACTSTEVLIYEVPAFRQVGYVSLPCFNDLHHVRPTPEGNLLVANTGLDMVVEFTPEGRITREWSVLGDEPWQRFSKATDYRLVESTKPHKSHPNYVFLLDGEIWVTRCFQADAICLTRPGRRIAIDIEKPHDGLVRGDSIYFTTVDGNVVLVDRLSLKPREIIDLKTIDNDGRELPGWCRGLMVADQARVWVGFTRIRATKFKENVRWVKHFFHQTEGPTHVALYDLVAKRRLKEIDLEQHAMNVVFDMLPAVPDH